MSYRARAQEIVAEFPQLTVADVHAAMAYYWDNQELMQQQMKRAEEVAEEVRKKYPPKLPKVIRRRSENGDSVPS